MSPAETFQRETTPPSGVSTDLSSALALLQPCPFAPSSAWLPVHPCISLNPSQSKHIPSCPQHTDIPAWRGAGYGQARRKQSKRRAALLGAGITLKAPPCTGAASQAARVWDVLLCPHSLALGMTEPDPELQLSLPAQ